MKKLVILSLAFLFSLSAFAQSGMQFTSGDWASVLSKAKKENKLIFVDAYTTWCGPCKMMSSDVFPTQPVGDFYNSNFVNVKIDMEKGEGLTIAKNFNVRAYPTYLFVNGDGDLVHRGIGFLPQDKFIALGEKANDPKTQLMPLRKKYESGDRSPALLKNYTMASYDAGEESYTEVADAYLKTQANNLDTEENMSFLMQFANDADSPSYKHLIKNKAKFINTFGEDMVGLKIRQVISQKIYSGDGAPLNLTKIDALYKEGLPDIADKLSAQFRMNYYRRAMDLGKYVEATTNYLNNFKADDWNEYNNAAWDFYEMVDDKKALAHAASWAKKSVSMDTNFYNTDTAAAVYYKLGDKRNAKKFAKKAIKIAKKEGEDYTGTSELFSKIKKL